VGAIFCLAVTVSLLNAQSKYQTIRAFGFPPEASSSPRGSVIEGPDGALYGVTESGGSNNFGTVYRVSKDGSVFTILKSFSGSDGRPSGRLLTTNGFLYGTTDFGGVSNRGTIFRLNLTGTDFVTMHQFTGADGAFPNYANLMLATDGLLYGVTWAGGVSNLGTVFRFRPEDGDLTVMKSFLGVDGANPVGPLVQGSNGVLYGTTTSGGISNQGTIFKLASGGGSFQVLKHFLGTNDGALPYAGLVFGTNGLLFGTTQRGGDFGRGTLFAIDSFGSGYAVLKSFGGSLSDQGGPYGLTAVNDFLFGVTYYGGSGFGTVFCVNHDGSDFRTIRTFSEQDDVRSPYVSLHHASVV
jgi:uncharacterized repeat protein (TIGR03803 family)